MSNVSHLTTAALPSFRLQKLADAHGTKVIPRLDLPTPNIYFVTVNCAIDGSVNHLYVAADFSGAALRKVQNICSDKHGFRPYRSNSVIKMRRLRLQDMLETPSALAKAIETAKELGEKDIVAALEKRPEQIAALLQGPAVERVDFDAVARALAEQLRTLDKLPA